MVAFVHTHKEPSIRRDLAQNTRSAGYCWAMYGHGVKTVAFLSIVVKSLRGMSGFTRSGGQGLHAIGPTCDRAGLIAEAPWIAGIGLSYCGSIRGISARITLAYCRIIDEKCMVFVTRGEPRDAPPEDSRLDGPSGDR